jgi:hypothetical protein
VPVDTHARSRRSTLRLRIGVRACLAAPVTTSTSASMIRSAAKASMSRTRSASASFSTNSISVILSSVIVGLRVGSKVSQPRTSTENRRWPPNVAPGRALRYAEGSARGLLHHAVGHNLG